MGWAYGVLGKEGAEPFLQRALEAYRRSGNLLRQAALLSNLGVICQWEGRWDEALSYYERGRTESVKLGNTIDAALARMNVAEILSDRGELAEAQELLLDTLPLWRASRYRYLLGGCLWLLGRVSLRAGRIDEALARLEEAKTHFQHVKREEEILDVDAPDRGMPAVHGRCRRPRSQRSWRRLRVPGRRRRAPKRFRCSSAFAVTRCCSGGITPAPGRRWSRALQPPGRAMTCKR